MDWAILIFEILLTVSLVGEISRYMNLSCVLISRILSEAIDGFDNLVEVVNKDLQPACAG